MSLHRFTALTALSIAILPVAAAYFPPNRERGTDPKHLAYNRHILFIDKGNPHCSDSGGRTAAMNPATPWCGPAGLIENHGGKFKPGDTVYIKGGDYTTAPFGVTSSGSSDKPITLCPYPGDRVTIGGASGPT